MNRKTRTALANAQKAVGTLVELCPRGGELYRQNPKIVAHVSRTGKWHLNAIAGLLQALGPSVQRAAS